MKIFLSYRRDDSAGYAGRLADRLVARFGPAGVFRDLDSIAPGRDFTRAIEEAITESDAVLAVIGRHWLAAGPDGRRRLDNEDDYVRAEIVAALEHDVQVIPVLVDRAAMPAASTLPQPLRPFASRNALELSDSRWDYDVQRLVDALDPESPEQITGITPVIRLEAPGPCRECAAGRRYAAPARTGGHCHYGRRRSPYCRRLVRVRRW